MEIETIEELSSNNLISDGVYSITSVDNGDGTQTLKIEDASQVDGGFVEIDPTLTVSGAAADAKAVGDMLREIQNEVAGVSGLLGSGVIDLLDAVLTRVAYTDADGGAYARRLIAALRGTDPGEPDDPDESAYDVEQTGSTLIIRAANVTQSGTRLTIF